MPEQNQGARVIDLEANRQLQAELYGEPLSALVGRVTTTFGITQSRVAQILGISAAMLSQLASGKRIKLSHPATSGRLEALLDLAERVPDLRGEELQEALESIRTRDAALTHMDRHHSREIALAYLRTIARPAELSAAAEAARAHAPHVAQLLTDAGEGA